MARNALLLSQEYQKRDYDARHRHEEYKVGDSVYLSTQRYSDYGQIRYPSRGVRKLEPRYLGPYKIKAKVSSHAYRLDLPKTLKIHPVIHVRYLLRPRTATRFAGRVPDKPPPVEYIGEHPHFEVESILGKRVRKYGRGARLEYLVHWKGYPTEEDSWEPVDHLNTCWDLVMEWERSQTQQPLVASVTFLV